MASFSFDIVSEIDKAEMNNVFMQAEKEIQGRYDFKGTSAAIDWLDDKKGLKLPATMIGKLMLFWISCVRNWRGVVNQVKFWIYQKRKLFRT